MATTVDLWSWRNTERLNMPDRIITIEEITETRAMLVLRFPDREKRRDILAALVMIEEAEVGDD